MGDSSIKFWKEKSNRSTDKTPSARRDVSSCKEVRTKDFAAMTERELYGQRQRSDTEEDSVQEQWFYNEIEWELKNGSKATLRLALPDDESRMPGFYAGLSEQTVHLRWGLIGNDVNIKYLKVTCCNIQDIALIMHDDQGDIIGIGQLNKYPSSNEAKFSLVVADKFQGQGAGSKLLDQLIRFARDKGYERLIGQINLRNSAMRKLCRIYGFKLSHSFGDEDIIAVLELGRG